MSRPHRTPPSPLVEAAQALEEELRRIGSTAREALRLPLDGRRNLERTAASLAELGAVDARVQPLVQRLLEAVGALVADQQAQAEALQARAEELQRRRAAYTALVERYAGLGRDAQALTGLLAGAPPAEGAPEPGGAVPGAVPLDAVEAGMGRLAADAGEAVRAATAEGFDDLARDAEALRQRVLAARNKLGLLARRAAEEQAQQRPN